MSASLPIKDPGFVARAKSLFKLSDDQMRTLFASLEERKTTFSSLYVKKLLDMDVSEAINTRTTFIFLIHSIHSHKIESDVMATQLGSVGVDQNRVGFF